MAAGASWLDTALFITLTAEVITSDEIRILILCPTSIENFDECEAEGVQSIFHPIALARTIHYNFHRWEGGVPHHTTVKAFLNTLNPLFLLSNCLPAN